MIITEQDKKTIGLAIEALLSLSSKKIEGNLENSKAFSVYKLTDKQVRIDIIEK